MFSKQLFFERLRALREEKGLSMQEVATALVVPKPTYQKWENCSREAPYVKLCEIAAYFDVTTDYLLGQSDERRQKQ